MHTSPWHWFLEQLAPSLCLSCDKQVRVHTAFCGACVATIERSTDSRAPFFYGGAIAHALSRLKYEERREIGPVLGQLLVLGTTTLPEVDLIAPVPLHPSKLITRGYNQSVWLSRAIARAAHTKHDALLLKRTRETFTQAQLGVRDREENMRGAFAVRTKNAVCGKAILVVDDVRTTGATLGACAMALREAGARHVETLSLCRTERTSTAEGIA